MSGKVCRLHAGGIWGREKRDESKNHANLTSHHYYCRGDRTIVSQICLMGFRQRSSFASKLLVPHRIPQIDDSAIDETLRGCLLGELTRLSRLHTKVYR